MTRKLNTALLFLGLGFLAFLSWKVGPGELWTQLGALGWGVVPLILSEGLANLAHTVGWRHCIDGGSRQVPLWQLFRMAMAGWAINYLTPTASLGGEVTKAALLASDRQGPQAVSSVLMDKLSTAFAHLLFVVLGSFCLLWQVKLPMHLWLAMVMSSLLLTAGLVAFLLLQKHGKLGAFLRWLVARKVGGRSLQNAERNTSTVDDAIKAFYRERPMDLLLAVAWHFLGHSAAIFQTWMFLLLLYHPMPLAAVLAATVLGLWIDLLTFAIPMNLGGLEGSRILALKAIGFDAALGMTFGIAIRLAQVFWAIFGLFSYGLMTLSRPGVARTNRTVLPACVRKQARVATILPE